MIFKKKPQTVFVTKIFIDGQYAGETVKVADEGADWFRYIVLGAGVPFGLWVIVMQGVFRAY